MRILPVAKCEHLILYPGTRKIATGVGGGGEGVDGICGPSVTQTLSMTLFSDTHVSLLSQRGHLGIWLPGYQC